MWREGFSGSKNHRKVLIRHIWQSYLDICEDIRLTPEGKDLYSHRKETIDRCFGTAKEHHAMRYNQQIGKEKMAMKVKYQNIRFARFFSYNQSNRYRRSPERGPQTDGI